MTTDYLAAASWQVWRTPPQEWTAPSQIVGAGIPAPVPGTSAEAIRAHDGRDAALALDHDASDWWWRTTVTLPEGLGSAATLVVAGVATHWTLWWDGEEVGSGHSMFRPAEFTVPAGAGVHDLVLACRALSAAATPSRPRAPWRSLLVTDPAYRWHRSSALGRIRWHGTAAPVGPWRPIQLVAQSPVRLGRVTTRVTGSGPAARGVVALELAATSTPVTVEVTLTEVTGGSGVTEVTGVVEGSTEAHTVGIDRVVTDRVVTDRVVTDRVVTDRVAVDQDGTTVELVLDQPQLWWPHTHGRPAHYELSVLVDGVRQQRRLVGFRTLRADRSDRGFALVVNDIPVFARGACWVPADPLTLLGPADEVRERLATLAAAGANMVRVTGTTTWQDEAFQEACIALGLMLWQDCMLHTLPPVDDPAWNADVEAEIRANLEPLQGQPHLVVVSGGSETEQQPVLWGLPASRWSTTTLEEVIPRAVRECVDAIPVTSSPTGGFRPTAVSEGIAHYFGVGGYRRPLADARRSGVRFAAECLAFGVPPERAQVAGMFAAPPTRDDPLWRAGVAKDPSADWDFEEVTAHYARECFGADVPELWARDAEGALDVLRAAACQAMESTLAEWRRPGSTCRGALVLSAADLTPGAGWGLLDSSGTPKSTWHAASHAWQPRTVLVTDEGLDGPRVHLVNDLADPWCGQVTLTAVPIGVGQPLEVTRPVRVPARGSVSLWAEEWFESFLDLTWAWRFGPAGYAGLTVTVRDTVTDTVAVTETDSDTVAETGTETEDVAPGRLLVRTFAFDHFLAATPSNSPRPAPTLRAEVVTDEQGRALILTTDGLVPFVVIEGATTSDNWFHLAGTRRLTLGPEGSPTVRSALAPLRDGPAEVVVTS